MDRVCGAAIRWRTLKLIVDRGWSDLKPYRPLGSVVDGNGR
jgi:hypothetical protein